MSENLKIFLKDLIDDMENDKLNQQQTKLVGEFYMKYKFQNNIIQNNKNINKENEKDFIKFLTLGWYIYSIIDENL